MACLRNMTGNVNPAMIWGKVTPAIEWATMAGTPCEVRAWKRCRPVAVGRRAVLYHLRRYSATKKASLPAQKAKRTFWVGGVAEGGWRG